MGKKLLFILGILLVVAGGIPVVKAASDTADDSILARRYERYQKFQKYQLYKEYKAVKDNKKYKEYADRYALYKKSPKKYVAYAKYKKYYDDYQEYKKKRNYAEYGKYAFFDNKTNEKYGSAVYKAAYDRNKLEMAGLVQQQVADQPSFVASPKIKVGLNSFKKSDLVDKAVTIEVNVASQIKEEDGTVLAKIPENTEIRIFFDFSEKSYRVVSVSLDRKTTKAVKIIPDNQEQGTCEISNIGSYRGNIEIRYASFTKKLWIINELPIEYYVWGMGEAANNSPVEYLKALSIAYRTYGYWKVQNGTTYDKEGFDVTDSGSNQLYGGYGREDNQPNIVTAAKATAGLIAKYGDRIAITPYCSGTDGNTRSWQDVWGSDNYPWCKSVPDPLGIKSNAQALSGNHMVGMSATGAYNYAKQQSWDYEKILKYYYQGINLVKGW